MMMKIKKSRIVLVITIFLSVVIIAIVQLGLYRDHRAEIEERQAIEEEQFRIAEAYFKLHYALHWMGDSVGSESWMIYYNCERLRGRLGDFIYHIPIETIDFNYPFGIISPRSYLNIKLYEHRTGNVLPYEMVIEYLSEEFEPDGSLRLYNNGKHPEIESFVNWSWGRRREKSDYQSSISELFWKYRQNYASGSLRRRNWWELSPQMLDALARAEADPTYVLDLTSLYEKGY